MVILIVNYKINTYFTTHIAMYIACMKQEVLITYVPVCTYMPHILFIIMHIIQMSYMQGYT